MRTAVARGLLPDADLPWEFALVSYLEIHGVASGDPQSPSDSRKYWAGLWVITPRMNFLQCSDLQLTVSSKNVSEEAKARIMEERPDAVTTVRRVVPVQVSSQDSKVVKLP